MDNDPMAIARALQASFVSSGTHRGEGSHSGRSGRGGSRARGRGGSSRGGLAPRAAIYAPIPARSTSLSPSTYRTTQSAARPAPLAAGGLGGRVSRAPAAYVPTPAPPRASAPTARYTSPSSSSSVDLQAPLMKPPAPRRDSESAQLEVPSVTNGDATDPIYYQDPAPRPPPVSIDTTTTTSDNGGNPMTSHRQAQTTSAVGNAPPPSAASISVRSSVANSLSTTNSANPVASATSATPKVIHYQGIPVSAESIIKADAIKYSRERRRVSLAVQSETANTEAGVTTHFYQDRDYVPPVVKPAPTNTEVGTVLYSQDKDFVAPVVQPEPVNTEGGPVLYYQDKDFVAPVANYANQSSNQVPPVPNDSAHDRHGSQTQEVDLMDLDDAPTITSFPVLGINDARSRERAMLANDALLQPQPKCTCPKKPRGLGSSRWADPYGTRVVEEGHFSLVANERKPARDECPVHNPRPLNPLTPTAPEFVPRFGHTATSAGLALTPQASGQIPAPTPKTTGFGTSDDKDIPWLL